ncbi:RNA polymerase sigma factor [Candidatus Poribacteria bacterium]
MDQYRQGIHYNWQMANTRALEQESDAQEAMLGRDFEDIVAENESKIFNTIYSFTGNYEDALDLTQEAFISAYRHIDKFRQESNIYTWLYRIAINLCKKHYNRKKRQDSVFTSSLDDPETLQHVEKRVSEYRSATEILELDEEQSMIRREIACLPKKHRAVIILKYMQDLSYEEVADVLGCGVGTVKSRLSRAKEKLKQRLERSVEVGHNGL